MISIGVDFMDLLKRMNAVVEYIENNLTENIDIELLPRISGCSSHEFSHIFSFMADMSVSEYIRRRRLSQAVFDIQNGSESLVDISLK
jgi:AraC family transcriptional regulator